LRGLFVEEPQLLAGGVGEEIAKLT